MRLRRQLADAKAQRELLISEILRYDKAREVITAQIAAEPILNGGQPCAFLSKVLKKG